MFLLQASPLVFFIGKKVGEKKTSETFTKIQISHQRFKGQRSQSHTLIKLTYLSKNEAENKRHIFDACTKHEAYNMKHTIIIR